MQRITKYKNYILGVIGVLLTLTMFVGFKYLMKPKYGELPEVKLREINNKKSFAIMVQNDNGYEEYKSEDNTWPKNGYVFKEAKCTDNNGNLIENAVSFISETKTVVLETDKTVTCTLYFNKISLGDQIKNIKPNGLNLNIEGGMYRYQGQKTENIENYICLENNCESGSNDMYRIIGIDEEGNLKIIKETSLGTISYNNDLDVNTQWIDSNIYKALNTNENSFYNQLSENKKNMILEKDWYYGDMNYSDFVANSINLDDLYKIENGLKSVQWKEFVPLSEKGKENVNCNIISIENSNHYNEEMCYVLKSGEWQSIRANIGLLYLHDYYYAVQPDGLNCESTQTDNYALCKASWLNINKTESLISRRGYQIDWGFYGIYSIYDTGFCSSFTINSNLDYRPVFYLKNNLIVTSGNGNINSPFVVNIR